MDPKYINIPNMNEIDMTCTFWNITLKVTVIHFCFVLLQNIFQSLSTPA